MGEVGKEETSEATIRDFHSVEEEKNKKKKIGQERGGGGGDVQQRINVRPEEYIR